MESNDSRVSTAKHSPRNRRRKYVINPAFQWKYTLTIALTVFLISSVMSSVLYGVLHHQARLRMIYPETYSAEVTGVMFLFCLAFSLVTAGALGLWCVIATHRVCGPLFVLERHLAELAGGRIPNPRPLRKKDEFKDLYATFSRAVRSLKETRERELAVLSQALHIVRSGAGGDNEARGEALGAVANHLEELRKTAFEAVGGEMDDPPAVPIEDSESSAKTPVAVM